MTTSFILPPGPKPLPFIGNILDFLKEGPELFFRLSKDYGDVVTVYRGSEKMFLVSDPDLIRQILVKDHNNFCKGSSLHLLGKTLGVGLLTSPADQNYTRARQLLMPYLGVKETEAYSEATVFCLNEFHKRLINISQESQCFDICTEMASLQLEIGARYMFSLDLVHESKQLVDVIFEIFDITSNINLMPSFLHKIVLSFNSRLKYLSHVLDEMVSQIIERRRQLHNVPNDMLSTLIAPDSGLTGKVLNDQIVILMFASLEAPSTILAWLWYLLSINPDCLEKLHCEINTNLGGESPTFAHLPKLKYTNAIVAEVLRLRPPAWVISRKILEPYKLLDYVLPSGAEILMSPYIVQRDPRFFSDPLSFLPERWLNPTPHPKYAYFPFGGGPRTCSGEAFSWANLTLIVASLAQKWNFKPVKAEKVECTFTLTLKPKKPIILQAYKR